jgi:hypothetical protein
LAFFVCSNKNGVAQGDIELPQTEAEPAIVALRYNEPPHTKAEPAIVAKPKRDNNGLAQQAVKSQD